MRKLLVPTLLLIVLWCPAQAPFNFQSEFKYLVQALRQNHFSVPTIDDDFSRDVLKDFIERLDPNRLYFIEEDLVAIIQFEDKIDDWINGREIGLLKAIVPMYQNALLRSKKSISEISNKPFDFTINEKIELEWPDYSPDLLESKERWRKWLKAQAIDRLYALRNPQTGQFTAKQEADVRARLRSAQTNIIDRAANVSGSIGAYVGVQFLKALAQNFDAHTLYLTGPDVQSFMRALSTENFSFGITLEEDSRGDIAITHMVPGGPAWNSGELHVLDVITRINYPGVGAPISISGMSLDEVGEVLDEAGMQVVEFTVRKQSGLETAVRLRREKMHDEENVVKSFVLQGERKIGYVALPGFYTDWGDEAGLKCANDVAREVMKLKRENVEGIVLDVRYNGGGSLNEAIAMAGIFIDEGSLGIIKDRTGKLVSLKDMNRGSVFDGPMVILVNGQSASASEFLAAALQDYNRAVVVGSKTFGKATGQEIISLAPNSKGRRVGLSIDYNHGFVNVTELKIYRVTGRTVQGLGVMPDIVLPDYYDRLDFRESSLPHFMPSDTVIKNTYFRPGNALPVLELKQRSEERILASEQFTRVEKGSELIGRRLEKGGGVVSLRWSDYVLEMGALEQTNVGKTKEASRVSEFEVRTLESDESRLKIDKDFREVGEGWIKKLESDIYVDEAFNILCDFIKIATGK